MKAVVKARLGRRDPESSLVADMETAPVIRPVPSRVGIGHHPRRLELTENGPLAKIAAALVQSGPANPKGTGLSGNCQGYLWTNLWCF